jgi:hypothetical protein
MVSTPVGDRTQQHVMEAPWPRDPTTNRSAPSHAARSAALISGEAHEIVESAELQQAEMLDIAPWAGSERDVYVHIVHCEVTGRRIQRR